MRFSRTMSPVVLCALLVTSGSAMRMIDEQVMHVNGTSVQVSSSAETADVAPLIVAGAAWVAAKVGEAILKEVGKTLVEDIVSTALSKGVAAVINLDPSAVNSEGVVFDYDSMATWKLNSAGSEKPKYTRAKFGSVALINMEVGDKVRVIQSARIKTVYLQSGPTVSKTDAYVYGPEICPGTVILPGHLYIYTGQCGTWRDLTSWNNWHRPDFAEEMCGTADQWNGDETKVGECMTYVACALEEMYWISMPHPKGNAKSIPPTLQCSDAFKAAKKNGEDNAKWEWKKQRSGAFHQGWQCCADEKSCTGEDDWCGTDGLCCRHPGALAWPLWTQRYYDQGCERKGCHGWHCCVHK